MSGYIAAIEDLAVKNDYFRQVLFTGNDFVIIDFEGEPARSLSDRRMALWCAFIVDTPAGKIFHAGDTGYGGGAFFRDLFFKHRGFRLANLPIGAYEPRWFMRDQHMNPDDAVRAHIDLGADTSVAMHFGCFQLTDEGIDEPAMALQRANQAQFADAFARGLAVTGFSRDREGNGWFELSRWTGVAGGPESGPAVS